jgi:hypothetical protein
MATSGFWGGALGCSAVWAAVNGANTTVRTTVAAIMVSRNHIGFVLVKTFITIASHKL